MRGVPETGVRTERVHSSSFRILKRGSLRCFGLPLGSQRTPGIRTPSPLRTRQRRRCAPHRPMRVLRGDGQLSAQGRFETGGVVAGHVVAQRQGQHLGCIVRFTIEFQRLPIQLFIGCSSAASCALRSQVLRFAVVRAVWAAGTLPPFGSTGRSGGPCMGCGCRRIGPGGGYPARGCSAAAGTCTRRSLPSRVSSTRARCSPLGWV